MPSIDISVCIATYKRPTLLVTLLESIATQQVPNGLSFEIVVVDNDRNGSARDGVSTFAARHPQLAIVYAIEGEKNISLARNKSVQMAQGQYIAFIDDDEYAAPLWLKHLRECLINFNADAVFGPVLPDFPDNSPAWLKKGNFYTKPVKTDGAPINAGRTSNTLVKRHWLQAESPPFNPAFGLTGGGDYDFFQRIQAQGARLHASAHAIVYEHILPERLTLAWLLARAFRGGQGYAAKWIEGKRAIEKVVHYIYRASLSLIAMVFAVTTLPFGRHRAVWWLRKLFSNLGQLSVILPYRYREYK
jgi:succinoglycan biosynthesis protein ExoM